MIIGNIPYLLFKHTPLYTPNQHTSQMDIQSALYNYIERMVSDVEGMKVLLVDTDTVYLFVYVYMLT